MSVGLGPLSVRIVTDSTDRHVSRWASGLKFRKVAGGGHADMQLHIDQGRTVLPDLSGDDKVFVYDQSGKTIFEGFADNPGVNADAYAGQSFDINALGIMTVTTDRARPITYRTTDLSMWQPNDAGNLPAATASVGTFPSTATSGLAGVPAVVAQINPGQPVGTGAGQAGMVVKTFVDALQGIGGIEGTYEGGTVDSNFHEQLWPYPIRVGDTALIDQSLDTTSRTFSLIAGASALDTNHSGILWLIQHTGPATNVSGNDYWAGLGKVAILGTQVAINGTMIVLPRTTYVLASEVASDAVGRFLGIADMIEGARVSIAATTHQIDQLAYPQAVQMQQVLDDLAIYEPDMTWELTPSRFGTRPKSGGFGFHYREWDDDNPRYEISTRDGFNQPGGTFNLCNRVAVSWTDAAGRSFVTIVSSIVPALGTRVRDAPPAQLPAGQGSAANAVRFGQSILGALATPPQSGTAVVGRKIYDRYQGRLVNPWEIEPGYTVLVRETEQVLRMTEMSYDHDQLAATLVLGDPVYTTEQQVAAAVAGRVLRPLSTVGFVSPPFRWDDSYWDTGEVWG